MDWKEAYRRYRRLRKVQAQNEVAMEFANECREILGNYNLVVENFQLIAGEYTRMAFRMGNMPTELYVYIREDSQIKWRLASSGTALHDGYDYNSYEFDEEIRRRISEHSKSKSYEGYNGSFFIIDEGLPSFDVPEVWNVTPVGLMKGQARK